MWLIFQFLLICVLLSFAAGDSNLSNNLKDLKSFKKLLKTKTNILVCFTRKKTQLDHELVQMLETVAALVKGQGTISLIECDGQSSKLCKQLKIEPNPFVLKHYKDGGFHKDYDRKFSKKSLLSFMKDPAGDLPWDEDESAKDVLHLPNEKSLYNLLKKKTSILIMFYVPWCGYCKKIKPEYSQAATDLKGRYVLAAIDLNQPENTKIRSKFNISGFPTLLYFGPDRKNPDEITFHYEGAKTKNDLIDFMKNPTALLKKTQEKQTVKWSEMDTDVLHLTSATFDTLKNENSALVMFYAPWCSHCNRLKPHFEVAATELKNRQTVGLLAAVDATEESELSKRFEIKAFPTLKYFKNGVFKFDVHLYDNKSLIDFMLNPQEPPSTPAPDQSWSEERSDIVHLDDTNFKSFTKKRKYVLTIFYAPWCGHCKRSKPEFVKAAAHFKDDIKHEFVAVDCTSDNCKETCSDHNVNGFPTFVLFKYGQFVQKYNKERTEHDFVKFMEDEDFLSDGVDQKRVEYVIDNNWNSVFDRTSFVFVLFSTSECTNCKLVTPHFMKASESFGANRRIKFAIVDAAINQKLIETYQINEYPTLMLISSDNTESPVRFKGDLNFANFQNFLMPYLGKDEL